MGFYIHVGPFKSLTTLVPGTEELPRRVTTPCITIGSGPTLDLVSMLRMCSDPHGSSVVDRSFWLFGVFAVFWMPRKRFNGMP